MSLDLTLMDLEFLRFNESVERCVFSCNDGLTTVIKQSVKVNGSFDYFTTGVMLNRGILDSHLFLTHLT